MKRLLLFGLVAVLLAALAAGAAAWWAWSVLDRPRTVEPVTVEIPPGTDAGSALERLEAEGVLEDALLARLWLVHGMGHPPIQAGRYRFAGSLDGFEVLDQLVEGEVLLEEVTVIEGLTLQETADALVAAGLGERRRFLDAMADPAPIADLDPLATDLEGYLFPDTYFFGVGADEEEIVATLVDTFRQRWEERVRPRLEEVSGRRPGLGEAADDAGDTASDAGDEAANDAGSDAPEPLDLTPRELVTLASIVERETSRDDERPMVAGVYANRLRAGMGLYADPTVIYALQQAGRWDGNIRRRDLAIDSPYNTYVHRGLPPGPIASPGLASLLAAADPAAVPYVYFVSRNDGTHVFAETLAEHNRNVDRWQRRYWRERWARERAEGSGDGTDGP